MTYRPMAQKTQSLYGVFGRRDLLAIYLTFASLVFLIYLGVTVSVCQYLFVLLSLLAPVFLVAKNKVADYIVFCLVLFLVTPFIRRLADSYLGYSPVSMIMMTPYIATPLSVILLATAAFGGRIRFPLPIVFMIASSTYGYLLAFLDGRVVAGTFDLLKSTLPPCFALLIAISPSHKKEIWSKVTGTFLLFVPLISIYGYYQYAYMPRWDALWMFNSELDSIGQPVPYEVRVFSILNSPAVCANIMMAAILWCLGAKTSLRWAALILGTFGLSLTMFRSAWIALAVGLLYVLSFGPVRTRLTVGAAIGVIIFLAPPILVMTGTEEAIMTRVSSLFYLQSDNSASERSNTYQAFLNYFGDNLMGTGIGGSGVAGAKAGEGKVVVIDGGPLEVFSTLGIIFGPLYLGSFIYLCGSLIFLRPLGDNPELIGCKAILLAFLTLFASTTATGGESSFPMWLAVGFLLPPALKTSSGAQRSKRQFPVA